MVKLVVENGKPEVDDDGFVALVDIAYVGYVDEDWTLPQLLEQLPVSGAQSMR